MENIIKNILKPLSKALKVSKDLGLDVNIYMEDGKITFYTISHCNSAVSIIEVVDDGFKKMEPCAMRADRLLKALKGADKDSSMVIRSDCTEIFIKNRNIKLSISDISRNNLKLPTIAPKNTLLCDTTIVATIKDIKALFEGCTITLTYNDNKPNKLHLSTINEGEDYHVDLDVSSVSGGSVSSMFDPDRLTSCFAEGNGEYIIGLGDNYPLSVTQQIEGLTHKTILAPRVSNN